MNRNARTFLIVAGALIVAGGVLLFGAFAFHGFSWNFIDLWSSATREERGSGDFEERTYTFDADKINTLDLSDVSRDIRIVTDATDKITVVCYENEDRYYDVQAVNGVLHVEFKSRLSINWDGAFEDYTLTVYLPQKEYKSADINNVSGSINLPSMSFEGEVTLHTTSGTINAQGVQSGGKLTASSVSGTVNLSGLHANDLRVTTTSGTIDVEASEIADGISVSTTSGDVNLNGVSANGDVTVGSTSARISFDLTGNSDNYKFSSVSGRVQGTLAGNPDDFTIDANSVSGDENVPRSKGGPRMLRVSTTSGGIDVDIK